MIIKHYQYSAESILVNKSFEEGAIYYIEDTGSIYLDPVGGTERIKIANNIDILITEADRSGLLSPIPGRLYFVLESSKYYIYYNGTWYAGGGSNNPRAGLIYINPSATLPDGFLWCDGSSYLRSEYPELFAAIGTYYGSGDGNTTFNVPNLSTRVPIGSGDGYNLGYSGGDETDTIIITNTKSNTDTDPNDANTHLYTVVNYIISTGKDSKTLSTAEIISSMQVLPLAIEYGGTGGTDPVVALKNLGGASINYVDEKVANIDTGADEEYVDNAIKSNNDNMLLDIEHGGTGGTDPIAALSNLGGASIEYVDEKVASIKPGVDEEYVANAIKNATENMIVDVPTLEEHLSGEKMILSSLQYGTELPSTGVEGQVFFKIIV